MKRICIYSGSNLGSKPEYKENTKLLGKILAENNIELVFGVLNISSFFDPLIHMIKNSCDEGFMRESNLKLISISDSPSELIKLMENYTPPLMENKWRQLK